MDNKDDFETSNLNNDVYNENWFSETSHDIGSQINLSNEVTNNAFKKDFQLDSTSSENLSLIEDNPKISSNEEFNIQKDELNSKIETELENETKKEAFKMASSPDSNSPENPSMMEDHSKNLSDEKIHLNEDELNSETGPAIETEKDLNELEDLTDFERTQIYHILEELIKKYANKSSINSYSTGTISENVDNNSELVKILTQLLEQRDNQFTNQIKESVLNTSENGTIADGLTNILNGVGNASINAFKNSLNAISRQFKKTSNDPKLSENLNEKPIPSNIEYRLNQLKEAEARYEKNLDSFWNIQEMKEAYSSIKNTAEKNGISIEEMITQINKNHNIDDLSKIFNDSYKNSKEAQEVMASMEQALNDWQTNHEKLTDNFIALDSQNPKLQDAFDEYNNSADHMQDAVKKAPQLEGADKSHMDILMEYMDMIKEKIKEFISSMKNLFSNIFKKNNNIEDNAPNF